MNMIKYRLNREEKFSMSKFREYLLKMKDMAEAYLIDDDNKEEKTKDDYIVNAEEGLIVAFRLNFESKKGVKLTKVISGKIVENSKEDEVFIVETRNGLVYGVPYQTVVWVKTGARWPKGVYEEMKQGSVVTDHESDDRKVVELGGIDDPEELDAVE